MGTLQKLKEYHRPREGKLASSQSHQCPRGRGREVTLMTSCGSHYLPRVPIRFLGLSFQDRTDCQGHGPNSCIHKEWWLLSATYLPDIVVISCPKVNVTQVVEKSSVQGSHVPEVTVSFELRSGTKPTFLTAILPTSKVVTRLLNLNAKVIFDFFFYTKSH